MFNLVLREDVKERKDTLVCPPRLCELLCTVDQLYFPLSLKASPPLAILEPPLVRLVLRKGVRRLLGESLQIMMEKSFLIRKEYNSKWGF